MPTQTFASTFTGTLSTDDTLILGTCMLGSTYGQVKTGSLKRGADQKEVKNCKGGLRALLLMNPKTTLSIKAIFDTAAELPQVGTILTLPLVSLAGIVHDITVDWEEDGERQLSFEATGWDALGASPTVKQWNGSSYTSFTG